MLSSIDKGIESTLKNVAKHVKVASTILCTDRGFKNFSFKEKTIFSLKAAIKKFRFDSEGMPKQKQNLILTLKKCFSRT